MSTAPPPAAPRTPTHAERCRTLFARARHGVLSTLTRGSSAGASGAEQLVFPFGTLVSVACDDDGSPLLLLSQLAEHTQNLAGSPEASILVVGDPPAIPSRGSSASERRSDPASTASANGPRDPLALPRATLIGRCARIADELAARNARDTFLAHHPEATAYATFKDFAMYRLVPEGLRYVGGFGRMSWVQSPEYRRARPDPLAASEPTMIQHMNDDHPDSVLAYARAAGGIDDATRAFITAIDRYGFDVLAVTPDGERRVRVPFASEVHSTDGARRALIDLVREARAKLASRPPPP